MAVYLIGYDFKDKPEEDYRNLFTAIYQIQLDAWHDLDSTWMVSTDLTCDQVRDALSSHFKDGDKLLVVKIDGEPVRWATNRLDSASSWLKTYL